MNNVVEMGKNENVTDRNPFTMGYVVKSKEPFFLVLNRLSVLTNERVGIVESCKPGKNKDGWLYVINNLNLLFGGLGPINFKGKAEKEIKIEIKKMGDNLLVNLSKESKNLSKEYEENKSWAIDFFVGRLIVLVETD